MEEKQGERERDTPNRYLERKKCFGGWGVISDATNLRGQGQVYLYILVKQETLKFIKILYLTDSLHPHAMQRKPLFSSHLTGLINSFLSLSVHE